MEIEKKFIIMRGLPGSGKSTLAKKLADKPGQIFSTDDYWFLKDPETYNFDIKNLGKAHQWNQRRSLAAFDANIPIIIIDNTNTTVKEMMGYRPHIVLAQELGYTVSIEEPKTDWAFNIDVLFEKNTHNVPKTVIEAMVNRYEKDIKIENILLSKICKYT